MNNEPTEGSGGGDRRATTVYEQIAEMLRSPDAEMEDIAERLRDYPRLADRLLNQANSIEFALRHQISRVEHAIAIIGRRRAAETVLQSSRIDDPAKRSRPHFDRSPRKSTADSRGAPDN